MLTKLLKSDRWSSFINNKTEITNNEVTHDDVLNHAAGSLLRSADNRLESSQLFYLILLPFYCSHLSLPLATYTLCHRLNDKNSKRSLVYADCLLLCNCYVIKCCEVSGKCQGIRHCLESGHPCYRIMVNNGIPACLLAICPMPGMGQMASRQAGIPLFTIIL